MAGYSWNEFVDELRARTDIVEVVSGYMSLNRKGNRFWGCCPFHNEKTPSFSVDREKQFFYCFGCHKGGNVFSFVMEEEHVDFSEAVELLAERLGMEVPEKGEPKGDSRLRQRAMEAATAAARFFRDILVSPEGERARQYIAKREISAQTMRRFGLGYSPEGGGRLAAHLAEQGYTLEEMQAAGLVGRRDERTYDTFRGRVMFPIFDPRGRVIAFGGRTLGDGQPKYLNSSDTPIFSKRRNLYGLHMLRGITGVDTIHLVEGYVDVVSLVSHGVQGCVATLGTAVTPEQIRLMKRYCDNFVICYDGDEPGQKATARALQLFRDEGIAARVCPIPGDMDPDDYVKAHGAEGFLALERISGTDFLLRREKAKHDMTAQEGRAAYAMAAAAVLRTVTEPVLLEGFVRGLAVDTGYSKEVLYEQIGRTQRGGNINADAPVNNTPARRHKPGRLPDYVMAQRGLIYLMCTVSPFPDGLVELDTFTDEACRRVAGIVIPNLKRRDVAAYLMDALADDEALRSEAAAMLGSHEPVPPAQVSELARSYLDSIERHGLEEKIAALGGRIDAMPPQERPAALVELRGYMDRLGRIRQGRT